MVDKMNRRVSLSYRIQICNMISTYSFRRLRASNILIRILLDVLLYVLW